MVERKTKKPVVKKKSVSSHKPLVPSAKKNDKYGTLSMILGLVSAVMGFALGLIGIIAAVAAIVLARKQKKIGENSYSKTGFVTGIIGLIFSIIGFIFNILFTIFYLAMSGF